MTAQAPKPKVPTPDEIMSAAQAAADAAQSLASSAMRIPPASARLAVQLPDLVENLADAMERLNVTVDRLDNYLALAEPMLQAMDQVLPLVQTLDQVLPQLEAQIKLGNEVYQALSQLPGVAALGRFTSVWAPDDSSSRGDKK